MPCLSRTLLWWHKTPLPPASIGPVKSYECCADKDSRKEVLIVSPSAKAVPAAENLPRPPHPLSRHGAFRGTDGDRRDVVEQWCDNCEHPNSSLLRVVLIAEIIHDIARESHLSFVEVEAGAGVANDDKVLEG